MRKRYFVRNKPVTIEEIEGVVALRADARERPSIALELEALRSEAPLPGVDPGTLKPFEKANWRFVAAGERARRMAAEAPLRQAAAAGRLYRKENGTVVIATSRLVVQLDPQLS
jgi:hypothetical protein